MKGGSRSSSLPWYRPSSRAVVMNALAAIERIRLHLMYRGPTDGTFRTLNRITERYIHSALRCRLRSALSDAKLMDSSACPVLDFLLALGNLNRNAKTLRAAGARRGGMARR